MVLKYHSGHDYGGDVVKVYWQCSKCGRRFETVEHLDSIMIEVDKLPEPSYPITYHKSGRMTPFPTSPIAPCGFVSL